MKFLLLYEPPPDPEWDVKDILWLAYTLVGFRQTEVEILEREATTLEESIRDLEYAVEYRREMTLL